MLSRRIALFLASTAIAILATGCGLGTIAGSTIAIPAMHGNVHGGQQPVNNAHVFLYAVNQTAYAGASTNRLSGLGFALSDASGNFSMTAQNTCQAGDIMYAAVAGGNPGLSVGTFNNALTMMAVLGPCSSLTPSTTIMINEVTTVAAVYALAPFMSDVSHVGTSATNLAGLNAAIATAKNLVAPGGYALTSTTNGAGAVPQAEINSIANSISSCVNSTGIDFHCTNLYLATTPTGGTAATNVVGALLNLIKGPYNFNNVNTFFAQAPASPPFQPTLSTAPSDWSIAVIYNNITNPRGLAIDASGNVWVNNSSANSVTELSGTGALVAPAYTGGGLSGATALAFDPSGNLWVANTAGFSLSEFSSTGTPITTASGYSGAGLNGPTSIAVDGLGKIWATNATGAIAKLNPDGSAISPSSGYTSVLFSAPTGISVNPTGQVWFADSGSNAVTQMSNDGSISIVYSAGLALGNPDATAIDANSNVWISNRNGNVVVVDSGGGLVTTNSGGNNGGGGIAFPIAISIDGAGNAWVADSFSGFITGLNAATGANSNLQPTPAITTPGGIGTDASGNVWLAHTSGNSVVEFVGAGAPTITPISVAVKNSKIGTRP